MAIQLLANVLTVTNLAGGASTTLAHGLKVSNVGVVPTQVICDRASPLVVSVVTATTNTSLEHFAAAAPIPEIPSVIAGVKLIGV